MTPSRLRTGCFSAPQYVALLGQVGPSRHRPCSCKLAVQALLNQACEVSGCVLKAIIGLDAS